MSAIVAALTHTLQRWNAEGRIAIALSGGMDSMVLLDAASNQIADYPQNRFEAIHIHHGLSPNADVWANFCERECDMRGLPLTVVRVAIKRADVEGQGIEAAARAARYRAFIASGAAFVVTAQHADDQAETVLHQLLRGTGWAGLAGMGEMRELSPQTRLVRPFLHLDCAEIEQYAKDHQLAWIEDESNDDAAFTRNFLRQYVVPPIAQRFPHFRASLARAARHAAQADRMLEALARIDLQWSGHTARAELLDNLPEERQINALYHWLHGQGITPPSQTQLAEWARQLFRVPPGDRPHQAGGHDLLIVRKRGVLSLKRSNRDDPA